MVLVIIPDILNLYTFIGVKARPYLTLCGYSPFQLQEIYELWT